MGIVDYFETADSAPLIENPLTSMGGMGQRRGYMEELYRKIREEKEQ